MRKVVEPEQIYYQQIKYDKVNFWMPLLVELQQVCDFSNDIKKASDSSENPGNEQKKVNGNLPGVPFFLQPNIGDVYKKMAHSKEGKGRVQIACFICECIFPTLFQSTLFNSLIQFEL